MPTAIKRIVILKEISESLKRSAQWMKMKPEWLDRSSKYLLVIISAIFINGCAISKNLGIGCHEYKVNQTVMLVPKYNTEAKILRIIQRTKNPCDGIYEIKTKDGKYGWAYEEDIDYLISEQ